MNLQLTAASDGALGGPGPLRVSVHDLAAARIWGLIRTLAAVLMPYRGRDKPESQKQANCVHAKLH